MKTQAISMPGLRGRWLVLPLVATILAVLPPASAQAAPAPRPPRPAAAKALRVIPGRPAPRLRGYGNPWGYGPGPMMGPAPAIGHQIDVEAPDAPRWLVGLLVGFLVVLAAVLAAALAWILLRRRSGGAGAADAQRILERRLAEGAVDVEEFERRRKALRGDGPKPSR